MPFFQMVKEFVGKNYILNKFRAGPVVAIQDGLQIMN
jgi:hypothetical protein